MTQLRFIFCCALIVSLNANCQTQAQATTDSLASQKSTIQYQPDSVFNSPETPASFPGGMQQWTYYLMKNLNANTPTNQKAPAGTYRVIIQFIVSKKGKLTNFFTETKYGYGMEKEALRVIKNGPKWIPAQQNGQPVNSYKHQPVTFIINPG